MGVCACEDAKRMKIETKTDKKGRDSEMDIERLHSPVERARKWPGRRDDAWSDSKCTRTNTWCHGKRQQNRFFCRVSMSARRDSENQLFNMYIRQFLLEKKYIHVWIHV